MVNHSGRATTDPTHRGQGPGHPLLGGLFLGHLLLLKLFNPLVRHLLSLDHTALMANSRPQTLPGGHPSLASGATSSRNRLLVVLLSERPPVTQVTTTLSCCTQTLYLLKGHKLKTANFCIRKAYDIYWCFIFYFHLYIPMTMWPI